MQNLETSQLKNFTSSQADSPRGWVHAQRTRLEVWHKRAVVSIAASSLHRLRYGALGRRRQAAARRRRGEAAAAEAGLWRLSVPEFCQTRFSARAKNHCFLHKHKKWGTVVGFLRFSAWFPLRARGDSSTLGCLRPLQVQTKRILLTEEDINNSLRGAPRRVIMVLFDVENEPRASAGLMQPPPFVSLLSSHKVHDVRRTAC